MRTRSVLFRVLLTVGVMVAILVIVILGEAGSVNVRSSGRGTLGEILFGGAVLAALYFSFLGVRTAGRGIHPVAAAGRRRLGAAMSSGRQFAQGIDWTWEKVAIAAALLHLTLTLIAWTRLSMAGLLLGALLLIPGGLFEELFVRGGSRGGLTVFNVASSTVFFVGLVLLYRVRRWPAVVLGGAVAIGGFAVGVGKMFRAIGGP